MKYIVLDLKIIPKQDVDPETVIKLIEESMTNMPVNKLFDRGSGEYLGEIIFKGGSVWPKPCLDPES